MLLKLRLLFIITLLCAGVQSYAQTGIDSITIINPFKEEFRVKQLIRKYFFSPELRNKEIDSIKQVITSSLGKSSQPQLIRLYLSLSDAHIRRGQYAFATREAYNAMRVAAEMKDSTLIGLVYIKLGNIHYVAHYGEYDDKLAKGLALLGNTTDEELTAYRYYTMAKIEPDTAKSGELFRKALDLQRKIKLAKPDNYEVTENLGKYLNANGIYEEAIEVSESIQGHYFTLFYLNNYGAVKRQQKDYAAAHKIFTRALEICKKARLGALLRNIFAHLSVNYQFWGDKTKALQYLELQLLSEECLFEERYEAQYAEFAAQYETDQKDKALRELNLIIETDIVQKFILLVFIFGLLVVVAALFYGRKKTNQAKKIVEEEKNKVVKKNNELIALQQELSESESKLKIAQSIAKLANWELDVPADKISFSEEFPALFGLVAGDLTGDFRNAILSKVHPDDSALFRRYLYGEIEYKTLEDRLYRVVNEGNIRWIQANFSVVFNENKQPLIIRGTVQDVTLQKEEEEAKILIAAQQSFTRQLIEAQEEERKRIAGELHDGLGQDVLLLKNRVQLGIQNNAIDVYGKEKLQEINESAAGLLQVIREITYDLIPVHLERLGLTETINDIIAKVERLSGIAIKTEVENVDNVFTPANQLHFYRIIQECLNNLLKHSKATNASVVINRKKNNVYVDITDDGIGLIPNVVIGMGLNSIKNRVGFLNGILKLAAPQGGGMLISITVPLEK